MAFFLCFSKMINIIMIILNKIINMVFHVCFGFSWISASGNHSNQKEISEKNLPFIDNDDRMIIKIMIGRFEKY